MEKILDVEIIATYAEVAEILKYSPLTPDKSGRLA
jgi:hypothetical protein